MSNILQINSRLWQLNLGVVNSYLVKTEDGLLLIDAGYPNQIEKIFAAIREAGHDPAHIRHFVLTHGHIDHAGSAAEVLRRTNARTYAHTEEIELISKGIAERPGTSRTPGLIPALVYLFFIKFKGTSYEPLPIDQPLQHGDLLPLAGGIEVIHSPGHSAGHVALLLKKDGILIAGDICSHVVGLTYSTINEDRALARKSILRVADYTFDQAVFGHGKPLTGQANRQLRERFESTSLK